MNEFELIARYFTPLTESRPEALGLRDDAAVLSLPSGMQLAVSTDVMNEGTHFMAGSAPGDIAHKTLRAALSDLAAMGAEPLCYQIGIAFPQKPEEAWLYGFTRALAEDHKEFGVFCSGGDTTSIKGGTLSLSITVMGTVKQDQAITRAGAKDGDALVLTGQVGDAFIGLQVLRGSLDTADNAHFKQAYFRPRPRFDLLQNIRAHASAAIDISDGLVADLSHLCTASGVGADVQLNAGMFSQVARNFMKQDMVTVQGLLTGGDDYQLLLAVPQMHLEAFLKDAPGAVQIGVFTSRHKGAKIIDERGGALAFERGGWSHF